jgi:hypothetical protein
MLDRLLTLQVKTQLLFVCVEFEAILQYHWASDR